MKNYAGHRLSPWLGHLMISRQETARPLLTAGEVMQLPPTDELVLVSACHDPRQEGAVLRGRAAQSPRPPTTLAGPCRGGQRSVDPIRLTIESSPGFSVSRGCGWADRRLFFEEDSRIAASGVSACCQTTKRSWSRSRRPTQSSLSPMTSLTMMLPVPVQCGSAVEPRGRRRLIRMMASRPAAEKSVCRSTSIRT